MTLPTASFALPFMSFAAPFKRSFHNKLSFKFRAQKRVWRMAAFNRVPAGPEVSVGFLLPRTALCDPDRGPPGSSANTSRPPCGTAKQTGGQIATGRARRRSAAAKAVSGTYGGLTP